MVSLEYQYCFYIYDSVVYVTSRDVQYSSGGIFVCGVREVRALCDVKKVRALHILFLLQMY